MPEIQLHLTWKSRNTNTKNVAGNKDIQRHLATLVLITSPLLPPGPAAYLCLMPPKVDCGRKEDVVLAASEHRPCHTKRKKEKADDIWCCSL